MPQALTVPDESQVTVLSCFTDGLHNRFYVINKSPTVGVHSTDSDIDIDHADQHSPITGNIPLTTRFAPFFPKIM